jgi:hypothetical protein
MRLTTIGDFMTDIGPRHDGDPSTQANGPNRAVAPRDQLGALVGRWRSEGHLVADPSTRIRGTDTYVWLPGTVSSTTSTS